MNVATYRAILDIRRLLTNHLKRSLLQEPLLLEDAVGRSAPMHLQFITSWDAFDSAVEARFRNLQGYQNIVSKEFVLQDRSTKGDVSRTRP